MEDYCGILLQVAYNMIASSRNVDVIGVTLVGTLGYPVRYHERYLTGNIGLLIHGLVSPRLGALQ